MRLIATSLVLIVVGAAGAACPPSCPLPGGGTVRQDCHAEFATTAMRLNYPPFDPARPRPAKEVRCFDGEPGCDVDGVVNGECAFPIDVCLLKDPDPALPACTAATVTGVEVPGSKRSVDLGALADALAALVPGAAGGNVCTSGHVLHVPLVPDALGRVRPATGKVKVRATSAAGNDLDKLKLTCVPHGWPSHGFDHLNRRSTPLETTLGPLNAASIVQRWNFDVHALEGGFSNGVTSTPTVGNGLVYVTSWSGKVYAVRQADGSLRWRYDTGVVATGVQSSPTLTADGRVLLGDSIGGVHCLDARTGRLLWHATLGAPALDAIWSSPQVANGRVFVGIASHNDQPCTKGRLVALDLDTGATLWTFQAVPDSVCHDDTTIACTSDADCGGTPGSCEPARGAGITATVAIDEPGTTVYAATVGCYTYPSLGDEDSILSFDAATGAVHWKYRTVPGEQFPDGPPYHDYGFLNGPILADADDGLGGTRRLVVGASKNGTLYALDTAGVPVWTNPIIPLPEFAGFGLFNGAPGFAGHRVFATLYNGGGSWPDANDHLYAFHDLDGTVDWSAPLGPSWSGVAVANGLVFAGSNDTTALFVHDASTGALLNTLALPSTSASGAAVVDGVVYVGYGIFAANGGVAAFGLP